MSPEVRGLGTLFLVVGPSGAGKDSLIDGARGVLGTDSRYVFAQRVITRPADAGGEAHRPATPAEFEELELRGAFSLSWQAHGLRYGIPRSIEDELRSNRNVVANVSRSVLDVARARYAPLTVVYVTAPHSVLAERLAQRGREPVDAIVTRLRRAGLMSPAGDDVVTIVNDGALCAAVDRFVAVLRSA